MCRRGVVSVWRWGGVAFHRGQARSYFLDCLREIGHKSIPWWAVHFFGRARSRMFSGPWRLWRPFRRCVRECA